MKISVKRREIIETYLNDSNDNTLDTIINVAIRKQNNQNKHKHTKTVENSILASFTKTVS